MTTQPDNPAAQEQVSDQPGLVDDSYAPEGMKERLGEEVEQKDPSDSSGAEGSTDDDQKPQGLSDADREGAGVVEEVSSPDDAGDEPGSDTEGPDSETETPPGDTGVVSEAPD